MNAKDICRQIERRLEEVHIRCFEEWKKPLLLISEHYFGVWLEHVYDSVFYAMMDGSKLFLAENTVDLFISNQKEDGQLPFCVKAVKNPDGSTVGYSQIQECVSFARLCLTVYRMNGDRAFLERCYESARRWVEWLCRHRMTTGRGLIEMFVGYDTGHDNSGRLQGLSCPRNYTVDGVRMNAAILPEDDAVPILAVDMNCNFYGTLRALAEMARELSDDSRAEEYEAQAAEVKARLFDLCYNAEDCFFYDVDKHGRQRKYLSSTIFHLFLEGVLDREADAELIRELYERHISNPEEFATPYPYPAMAACDPSTAEHIERNCWGYYSQGLIALRSTLWMEKYGFTAEHDRLCERWVRAWTEHFDMLKLGQELDPHTGIPSKSSEWYSSTMLFYLYAARRLGLAD